jgi:hypothetical protein
MLKSFKMSSLKTNKFKTRISLKQKPKMKMVTVMTMKRKMLTKANTIVTTTKTKNL